MQTILSHFGLNLTKPQSPPLQNLLVKVIQSHPVAFSVKKDNACKKLSIGPIKWLMNIDYLLIISLIY